MDRIRSLRSGISIAIDWRRSSVPQAPRDWPNIRTCVNAVIGYTGRFRIKPRGCVHLWTNSVRPRKAKDPGVGKRRRLQRRCRGDCDFPGLAHYHAPTVALLLLPNRAFDFRAAALADVSHLN